MSMNTVNTNTVNMNTVTVLEPATENILAELPAAGIFEVDAAVAKAKKAFPAWRAVSPAARANLLRALGDAVNEPAPGAFQRIEVPELNPRAEWQYRRPPESGDQDVRSAGRKSRAGCLGPVQAISGPFPCGLR